MNKIVVKITLEGNGQSMMVECNELEIGSLIEYFHFTDRITVTVSPDIHFPFATTNVRVREYDDLRLIKRLGNFESNVKPGSGDIFILELMEMDEKEFEALPEFKGWQKGVDK